MQKTYTVDFLTKKRVVAVLYIVLRDNAVVLEAIIPHEIFMQVQEELIRRRCVHISKNGKKRSYSSNHCFAQMIRQLRRGFPQSSLEQPWEEVHCLALRQQAGEYRPILRCPDGTGKHH